MFKSALLAGAFSVAVQATYIEAVADIEACNEADDDLNGFSSIANVPIYASGQTI